MVYIKNLDGIETKIILLLYKMNNNTQATYENFLGSKITPLKIYKGDVIGKKIVVSTVYFFSSLYKEEESYEKHSLTYFTELIKNIESFQIKINEFTSKTSENINANTWIYRVYIDNSIFRFDEIIANIESASNNNKKNSLINTIIKSKYKELYFYLAEFIKQYIDKITKETTTEEQNKYKNIEIFTYENENLYSRLISNSRKIITGHIETYGTLIRLHPLIEPNIDVCIMRNCSCSFTPLDIKIQDYWINTRSEQHMEYSFLYTFNKNNERSKTFKNGKDYYACQRKGAGLYSCKLDDIYRKYFTKEFNDIYKNYLAQNNKNPNIKKEVKFCYGIDELVLSNIIAKLNDTKIIPDHTSLKLQLCSGENSKFINYNNFELPVQLINLKLKNHYEKEFLCLQSNDKYKQFYVDCLSLAIVLRAMEFKIYNIAFTLSKDIKYANHLSIVAIVEDNTPNKYNKFNEIFSKENIKPILFIPELINDSQLQDLSPDIFGKLPDPSTIIQPLKYSDVLDFFTAPPPKINTMRTRRTVALGGGNNQSKNNKTKKQKNKV